MGGISTSFTAVKANVALSIGVAATGICLPIALSFSLRELTNASQLQAFTAGASLCSTSLGTTIGPLGVGLLVRRVRTLQKESRPESGDVIL